jgi:hypothetical protein
MHWKLGHHPMGGKFFHNHINFHHVYYSKDHLVSPTYLGDEGKNVDISVSEVYCLLLAVTSYVVEVAATHWGFHRAELKRTEAAAQAPYRNSSVVGKRYRCVAHPPSSPIPSRKWRP